MRSSSTPQQVPKTVEYLRASDKQRRRGDVAVTTVWSRSGDYAEWRRPDRLTSHTPPVASSI